MLERQTPPQMPQGSFSDQVKSIGDTALIMERRGSHEQLVSVAGRMSDLTLRSAVFLAQEHGLQLDGVTEPKLNKLLQAAHRTGPTNEELARMVRDQTTQLREGRANPRMVLETAQSVFHEAAPNAAQYFNHLEAATLGAELIEEIIAQNPDLAIPSYIQGNIGHLTTLLSQEGIQQSLRPNA